MNGWSILCSRLRRRSVHRVSNHEEDLAVHLDKRKVIPFVLLLVGAGFLLLALLTRVPPNGWVEIVLLILGTLTAFYLALALTLQLTYPALILRTDGFLYQPPHWPPARRPGALFIPWKDVRSINYVYARGGHQVLVFTKDSPPPKRDGRVLLTQLNPAARIPVMLLTVKERDLLREMRERAWRQGVVLR